MTIHDDFTELVVGYALDALEPVDEQLLVAHLATCLRCQTFLDEMRNVGSALAQGVADAEPPAALFDFIKSVAATPQDFAGLDDVSEPFVLPPLPLDSKRVRRRRHPHVPMRALVLSAAAVAVLALAGLSGYAVHERSGHESATAALQSEQQVLKHLDHPGAYTVTLASGGAATGAAIVDGTDVYLVAHDLGKNDTATSIYVLWAADPTGRMVAVGSFDVRSTSVTIVSSPLPASVGQPQKFGVTHEAGRQAPAVPGTAVLGVSL